MSSAPAPPVVSAACLPDAALSLLVLGHGALPPSYQPVLENLALGGRVASAYPGRAIVENPDRYALAEDMAAQQAAQEAAQKRYGATWRRRWTCPPARSWQLLCELRGDPDPYAGRRLMVVRVAPAPGDALAKVFAADFSVRTSNALRRAGIVTVADLTSRTSGDLLRVRNFGRKALGEVQDVLYDHHLSLKESR